MYLNDFYKKFSAPVNFAEGFLPTHNATPGLSLRFPDSFDFSLIKNNDFSCQDCSHYSELLHLARDLSPAEELKDYKDICLFEMLDVDLLFNHSPDIKLDFKNAPINEDANVFYISSSGGASSLGTTGGGLFAGSSSILEAVGLDTNNFANVSIESGQDAGVDTSYLSISSFTKGGEGRMSVMTFYIENIDSAKATSVGNVFLSDILLSSEPIIIEDSNGVESYLYSLTDLDILNALANAINI